jgi:hypothetical protein
VIGLHRRGRRRSVRRQPRASLGPDSDVRAIPSLALRATLGDRLLAISSVASIVLSVERRLSVSVICSFDPTQSAARQNTLQSSARQAGDGQEMRVQSLQRSEQGTRNGRLPESEADKTTSAKHTRTSGPVSCRRPEGLRLLSHNPVGNRPPDPTCATS